MRIFKTEGIIIKRKNFGEADKIITVMSKDYGKLTVLAKGIRKISSRRSGHLEVFGQAQFTLYQGKTFDSVTEVTRIQRFQLPYNDLSKVSYAYYMCELTDLLLPERQEHEEVYHLLEERFSSLCHTTTHQESEEEVSVYALQLLRMLGFLPEHQDIPQGNIHTFIESIVERKLKTPKFIEKVV